MAAAKRSTVARKALKREDGKYNAVLRKLRAETKAPFPKGFAEMIEDDLTGSGKLAVPRRFALVYLDRPWPKIAKLVHQDRDFAVSTAHIADVLHSTIQSYKSLFDWLTSAELRMLAAITTRKDSEQVMRDGEAQTKEAATPASKRKTREIFANLEVPHGYVVIPRLEDHKGGVHG